MIHPEVIRSKFGAKRRGDSKRASCSGNLACTWPRPNAAAPASLHQSFPAPARSFGASSSRHLLAWHIIGAQALCCYEASRRSFLGPASRLSALANNPTPATPSRLSDTNSPRTQHRPLHVGDQPYTRCHCWSANSPAPPPPPPPPPLARLMGIKASCREQLGLKHVEKPSTPGSSRIIAPRPASTKCSNWFARDPGCCKPTNSVPPPFTTEP